MSITIKWHANPFVGVGGSPITPWENWRKMPDYRVKLENFTGPMDLLLYLVRRNEVDIVQLPIARITIQFLQFLELLQLLDLDLIGDFVVMASALIEIKSRQVLPRTEEKATE